MANRPALYLTAALIAALCGAAVALAADDEPVATAPIPPPPAAASPSAAASSMPAAKPNTDKSAADKRTTHVTARPHRPKPENAEQAARHGKDTKSHVVAAHPRAPSRHAVRHSRPRHYAGTYGGPPMPPPWYDRGYYPPPWRGVPFPSW